MRDLCAISIRCVFIEMYITTEGFDKWIIPYFGKETYMKYYRYLLTLLVALTFTVFASILITPPAYAKSQAAMPQASSHSCAVTMVYLHGANPPTTTCLKQSQSSGLITPDTYGSDCSNQTLALRSTDQYGDQYLCFLGTGFVNLTDYVWRTWWPYSTWNDAADWYGTGCNTGVFFADVNGNGTRQTFGPGRQVNFDGQSGRLPDRTLSSFRIDVSC